MCCESQSSLEIVSEELQDKVKIVKISLDSHFSCYLNICYLILTEKITENVI